VNFGELRYGEVRILGILGSTYGSEPVVSDLLCTGQFVVGVHKKPSIPQDGPSSVAVLAR
jgi:hypothetical protein